MATASKVANILHEEHFWAIVLINALETQVSAHESEPPIDPKNPTDRRNLEELLELLESMIRHHAFEEGVLFPMIRKNGHGSVVDLFTDEHSAMGPCARRLQRITVEILDAGMTDERLETFAKTLREFSEYVMLHIQKEELVLVQKLHTLIDPETDKTLAATYREQQSVATRCAAG